MGKSVKNKYEAEILILAFAIGVIYWFLVALIELIFESGSNFWDLASLQVAPYDLLLRFLGAITIVTFGIVLIRVERRKYKTEEILRKTERTVDVERGHAQQYFDIAPVMFIVLDAVGNVVSINKKGCEILEEKEQKIVGKNWFKFFLPYQFRERMLDIFRKMISGEIAVMEYYEYPVSTFTGRERNIAWQNALFQDLNGNVTGIVSAGEDITERSRTENALHESEHRYRELANSLQTYLDIAAVIFLVLDARGFVTLINKKGCEILGAEEDDIVGKSWFEYFIPEPIRQKVHSTFLEMIGGQIEQAIYLENAIITAQGEERLIAWHNAPILDPAGQIKGTVSSGEDITERRLAEEALRESEEKYRNLYETVPVGIGVVNMQGQVMDANMAMQEVTGYSIYELKTLDIRKIYVNPRDRDSFVESLRKTGVIRDFDVKLRRKDGTNYDALLNAATIKQGGQKFLLTNVRDITARKRAEEDLQHLYEESVQLSQTKSNLLTFAAHELKTPLVPIVGWAELMKNSMEKGKKIEDVMGYEDVLSMYNASMRLNRIIENFLDVNRIEMGRFELQPKMNSAFLLIQNAMQNVQSLAASRDLQIHVDVEDMDLYVDGFRVEHIFINILTNAIKNSAPNTEIWISSSRDASFYTFKFVDQGIGFTPQEIENVWHPFSPSFLRNKSEQGIPGTGVGLSLAKGIVELHKGIIQIFSEGRDKGSTIIIAFPVNSPAD